ncbi:hypothetical protein EZS27_018261 [termite gut metagenome]|uniref:O-antigen ligase domain-containing protein n=1 Tax=termite gut metagenome TaxID=433724 RepID=A0A5J4RIX5_9ZZZZ
MRSNNHIITCSYNSIYLLLISIIMTSIDFGISTKMILYPVCAILSIILFIQNNKIKRKSFLGVELAYLMLIVTSLLRFTQYTYDLLSQVIMFILAIFPFIFISKMYINIKWLNYIVIICFLISNLNRFNGLSLTPKSFLNSDIGIESPMLAYIFPLFMIFWMNRNNKRMILVNLFIIIIAGKRIALLSSIIILLMNVFNVFTRNNSKDEIKLLFSIVIILINISYLIFSYFFALGYFDDFIYEQIGVSSNFLTQGRQSRYEYILNTLMNRNNLGMIFLFGIGLGNTNGILEVEMGHSLRIHNDISKLFYESGFLFFILFFILFYKKATYITLPYLLYVNMLYLTDNALIYVPVIFSLILFLHSEELSKEGIKVYT